MKGRWRFIPSITTTKNDNESNEHLIRRFVRKVQASGKLNRAKKGQFKQPTKSKRLRRQAAIRRTVLQKQREYLRKIGKLDDYSGRSRRKRN